MNRRLLGAVAGLAAASLTAGCAASAAAGDQGESQVITISARACGTGWRHPHTGLQNLEIRNATTGAVEISLVDAETGAVYAKLEGLGPGTTRSMPVDIGSGNYAFSCDGNEYGNALGPSVRVPGHVTGGEAILPPTATQMATATHREEAYVTAGLTTLARQAAALAAQIKAGDLAAAKVTWLAAHLTFERLGSAYGMFGPYDDEIDGTPFGLAAGVSSPDFTGLYRLEYGLWHDQSAAELTRPAGDLVMAIRGLVAAWPGMQLLPPYALSDLALRTHEVLENAIRFQLSGQDNFGSGTNMATMAAAVDATSAQLKILQPLLVGRYRDLAALYNWLGRLRRLVDAAHLRGGWVPVAVLSASQREDLDSAAGQTVELLGEVPPMFEAKPMP